MQPSSQSFLNVSSIDSLASVLGTSAQQLKYLLYGRAPAARYVTFRLAKRKGGCREIRAPRHDLKSLQRKLAHKLADVFQPKLAVHGFSRSRSIKTNAAVHVSKRFVFNADLRDFFPSINFGRVRGLFLSRPFQFPPQVATVLAQICCHENQLPQGAPTSPIVSNLICWSLDTQLMRLAKHFRCTYTRYADDITFSKQSSDFPVEIGFADANGAFVGKELRRIIESNGFRVHDEKVHLQNNRRRQRVTGLIVNKSVNVPRRFIRQIRAMIHAWAKYGEDLANRENAKQYYRRIRKDPRCPELRSVIHGKLEFVKMVKGVDDPVYKNLQRQYVRVCPEYLSVMRQENDMKRKRDLFLSHASEDKPSIAQPLADALISAGMSVWYDEYEIKLGDSLLQKINEGLIGSRYGVVILSKAFFQKRWPKKELDGLAALENADGRNRILPIWHEIGAAEVTAASPILAGLRAVSSADLIRVVAEIKAAVSQ